MKKNPKIKTKRKRLTEQSSENSEKFVKSFSDSRKNLFSLSDTSVRNMLALIKDFQQEAVERLRFDVPENLNAPFNIRILPSIQDELNTSLETLRSRSTKELSDKLGDGFDLGQGVTARSLKAVGVPVAFPTAAPAVLTTLARDAENVFSEIISDLGERITGELNKSAAGLQSSSQTISRINRMLETSPEVIRGQRRRIKFAFQAEEIVRTELGRVYSNAQQLASEQLATAIPDLKKRWITIGDIRVRRGHVNVENAYAPGGAIGPIRIDQRFRVTDFSRTGRSTFMTLGGRIRPKGFTGGLRVINTPGFTRKGRLINDRMLFPRDPSGSAGNVVQCRCTVMDVLPELEEATDRAMGILNTE